jgi:hypothetical protein
MVSADILIFQIRGENQILPQQWQKDLSTTEAIHRSHANGFLTFGQGHHVRGGGCAAQGVRIVPQLFGDRLGRDPNLYSGQAGIGQAYSSLKLFATSLFRRCTFVLRSTDQSIYRKAVFRTGKILTHYIPDVV